MSAYFFVNVSSGISSDEKSADDLLKKLKLALNAQPIAKNLFVMRSICGAGKNGIVVETFPGNLSYENVTVEQIPEIVEAIGSLDVSDFDNQRLIQILLDNMSFTLPKICGKCCPCRLGGPKIEKILKNLQKSSNNQSIDLCELDETAFAMQQASMCAIGMFGADPVLFALKNFWKQGEA
ncbi:MAG: NADH-ubiquinone oxidoreductase-F iron-sulfur binding region domain-containing protein [Spirochaetia bacterium]